MADCALIELYQSSMNHLTDHAYVFVVPGIGTPSPQEWRAASQQPWLKTLVDQLDSLQRGCTIVEVRHGLTSGSASSLDDLSLQGKELLREVEAYRSSRNASRNPFVFISHSLGGVVLKHALVQARRSREDHDAMFVALQGLVFLSTPHLGSRQPDGWQQLAGLLLNPHKQQDGRLATKNDLRSIFEVSVAFEDMALAIPVLSASEKRATKPRGLKALSSNKSNMNIFVDTRICRIGSDLEQLIEIDAEHREVCMLDDKTVSRERIMRFLCTCLSTSKQEPGDSQYAMIQAGMELVIRDSGHHPDSISIPSRHDSLMQATRSFKPSLGPLRDPELPCSTMEQGAIVDDFFARQDILQRLDDVLLPPSTPTSDTPVRTITLHGVGGIGKTSTAAQYLKTRLEQGKYDAMFWIRADAVGRILDSFDRIAVKLGLLDPDQIQDRSFNRKLVMDWLENPIKTHDSASQDDKSLARWLIVFDDVDDMDVLNDFWPRKGGGAILITSRDPTIVWRFAEGEWRPEEIKLSPFNEDEGAAFLRKIAPRAEKPNDPNASLEVAKRLDCIPLALRQMGGIIRRRQMTFAKFLRLYQDEGAHATLHNTSIKMNNPEYHHNLATVWALEKLSAKTLSLINVLALLDPDHIKEELLTNDSVTVQSQDFPSNMEDYYEAREKLSTSSLITIDDDEDEISLHRTVQDAARAKMDPAQFHDAFETAAALLLHVWPVKGQLWNYPVEKWPECQALSPHILRIHSHYTSNSKKDGWQLPTLSFVRVLVYGGWYWYQRGDADLAKLVFTTAENLCTEQLTSGNNLLSDIWMCQGCVATETNDGEACVKYYQKFLDRTEQRIPLPKSSSDYETKASAYNEMGIGNMMIGKVDDAVRLFQQARLHSEVHRQQFASTLSIFMFASANLGFAHWIKDRWDDALDVLMHAYQVHQKRKLEGESESYIPGRLMHAVGNVKISQGQHEAGLWWHQASYKQYIGTIGEGHHRIADVCHRLADDYRLIGDLDEARKYIDRALKVFDSKKCYTPEKMRTTYLLGTICTDQGKADQGQQHFEAAKRMYTELRRSRGEDIPSRELTQSDFDRSVTFWSR